jgi:hypothetical protein
MSPTDGKGGIWTGVGFGNWRITAPAISSGDAGGGLVFGSLLTTALAIASADGATGNQSAKGHAFVQQTGTICLVREIS